MVESKLSYRNSSDTWGQLNPIQEGYKVFLYKKNKKREADQKMVMFPAFFINPFFVI